MDEARTRSPPVRPARPISMTPLYDDLPQRSTGGVATNTTPPLPASGHPSITKRRSIVNIRAVSQSHSKLPVQTGHGPVRYSTGASTLGSDKKGSFRNAVRKLFGRKSKVDPVPVQHSPPRHGYHKSDPGNFPKPQTITEYPPEVVPKRTLSAPLHMLEPQKPIQRMRSPNAVAFPKSAQLKPLKLENPFYTRPPQPKRRATLPSLIMADREAAAIGAAIAGYEARAAGMSFEVPREVPESEIGVAITSAAAREHRKSRSAYDLRKAASEAQPSRKRSEEIQYWRDSYTGSVLLNLAPEAGDDNENEDVADFEDSSPRAVMTSPPVLSDTVASRPSTSRGLSSSAPFSTSRPVTAGGESSRDLEIRVAKLESSVLEFQQSLERITLTSRGSPPRSSPILAPRAIRRQHTPSMLVDTLQHPSWRPAPLDFEDAGEVMEREWGSGGGGGGYTSDRSTRPTLPGSSNEAMTAHNLINNNDGSFVALYNMLSEERSARRALESRVRHLQNEVSSLALHPPRGGHSSWSSFAVPGPTMLHQQRPRTPEESDRGLSSRGGLSPSPQRVVSRFSATSAGTGESDGWRVQHLHQQQQSPGRQGRGLREREQELEQDDDELYRTPLEESHPFSYGGGGGGGGAAFRRESEDMF